MGRGKTPYHSLNSKDGCNALRGEPVGAMSRMTLTTKRQASLPRKFCKTLGIHSGDQIDLGRTVIDDLPVWVLKPRSLDWTWTASAKVCAGASHDLDDIRASAARGRSREQRP